MKALLVVFVLVLVALLVGVGFTYNRWESQPPQITFDKAFTSLGHTPALQVKVEDAGTGLRAVSVHLKQKDKDTVLVEDAFPKTGAEKSKTYDLGKLLADKGQMVDGPATLQIQVKDLVSKDGAGRIPSAT